MGSAMGRQFWDAVVRSGSAVPAGHSLADLTDCLVVRPGDPDYLARVNTLNYLRALHFQLAAGIRPMPGVAAPEFFDRDPADRPAILAEITAALGKLDYGFWRTIPAQ